MGLNQHTGEPIDPQMEGIFDNYAVKRQIINSGYVENHLFQETLSSLILEISCICCYSEVNLGYSTKIFLQLLNHTRLYV